MTRDPVPNDLCARLGLPPIDEAEPRWQDMLTGDERALVDHCEALATTLADMTITARKLRRRGQARLRKANFYQANRKDRA